MLKYNIDICCQLSIIYRDRKHPATLYTYLVAILKSRIFKVVNVEKAGRLTTHFIPPDWSVLIFYSF